MKGYLLKKQDIIIGNEVFIESNAAENNYCVMFEDDAETGYFYAAERSPDTAALTILDMLLIYDVGSISDSEREASISVIWSTDWTKCGLIINSYCHAVFDFPAQGGYNRHEFPPPNDIWTKHERKLTDEMIAAFFS